MLASLLAFFRRTPAPAPQEQRRPHRHELVERGFKDPVIYFVWGKWTVEERDLAEYHGLEYEEPPDYGW